MSTKEQIEQWKGNSGDVCFEGRLCVPNNDELRQNIIQEVHSSSYIMHSGSTKMYPELKHYY
ncbi:zinc finger and BTB domain-containing protein 11-like [Gossypium australe]|uniref:Zinc finger and BTB domain-containing protein 11-like n=1 Tax=Gossypium australe TaxID=47621 RepID=A0A5B6WRS2_9ROSI|nr:zinc finger and BTB domain-containing protein 11-like [Gossypium australe]